MWSMRKSSKFQRISSKRAIGVLALVASFQFSSGMALAAKVGPGDLDPTFGLEGIVQLPDPIPSSNCYQSKSLALSSDGTLLVSTSCPNRLVSYNTDGSLNTAFGGGVGYVSTFGEGFAVEVLPNGKIVLASRISVEFPRKALALQRFLPDGNLDTSFGTNGTTVVEFDVGSPSPFQWGYDLNPQAMALTSGGNITVAGSYNYYYYNGFTHSFNPLAFTLIQLTESGQLDTDFGDQGTVITDIFSSSDPYTNPSESAMALALQSDGKILAGGYSSGSGTGQDLTLLRYNSDGSIDLSYGNNGVAITDLSSVDKIRAIALRSDNSAVVTGWSGSAPIDTYDMLLASYDVSGSLDTAFGTGGTVLFDYDSGRDWGIDVAFDSNDKILVAGSVTGSISRRNAPPEQGASLTRFLGNGSLDENFGDGGTVANLLEGTTYLTATALAIQSDDKIVLSSQAIFRHLP